ncbi:MAG: hypothetical protein ACRDRP_01205, partial [Pseudonocardiaceae bacterium]
MVSSGLVPGTTQTLTYQVHARDLVNTLFPESSEFCQGPVGTAQWRSWDLPGDGHGICPVLAITGCCWSG